MCRDPGSGGTGKACGSRRETYRPIGSADCSGSSNWLAWRADDHNATGKGSGISDSVEALADTGRHALDYVSRCGKATEVVVGAEELRVGRRRGVIPSLV